MENGNVISLMSVQSYGVGSRLGACGLVAHPSALWQRMVGVFFFIRVLAREVQIFASAPDPSRSGDRRGRRSLRALSGKSRTRLQARENVSRRRPESVRSRARERSVARRPERAMHVKLAMRRCMRALTC